MMNDIEIDLEDIEARLYSQIYHCSDNSTTEGLTPELTADSVARPSRYFHENSQMDRNRESNFQVPQVVVNPVNNFVLMTPENQSMSKGQRRRWQKRQRKLLRQHQHVTNVNVNFGGTDPSRRNKQGAVVYKERNFHCDTKSFDETCDQPTEVKTNARSEYVQVIEDTCVVILSSDDEVTPIKSNEATLASANRKENRDCDNEDDDVVFVPIDKHIEVIEVNDEGMGASEAGDSVELSTKTSKRPVSPGSSASNDFLDSNLETTQQNFNFALHGSDFVAKDLSKTKSCAAPEKYETESSASDISTPLKTIIFKEIPFDVPGKHIFEEGNMESFRNYITPKRDPKKPHLKTLTKTKYDIDHESSDSSVESDYESVRNVGEKDEHGFVATKASKVIQSTDPSTFENIYVDKEKMLESSGSKCVTPDKGIPEETTAVDIVSKGNSSVQLTVEESNEKNKEIDVILETIIETEQAGKIAQNSGEDKAPDVEKHGTKRPLKSETPTKKKHRTAVDVSDEDLSKANVQTCRSPENAPTSVQVREYSEEEFFDVCTSSDEDEWMLEDDSANDITLGATEPFVKQHEKYQPSSERKKYSFDNYWSDDRETFYRKSWGHENFDVREVQKEMSDDPSLWKITEVDRLGLTILPRGKKCRRCRQYGHGFLRCPRRLDLPKCILCGQAGHTETRCREKMCTTCGRETNVSTTFCHYCARQVRQTICSICNQAGHFSQRCPDLWRRYFFTTTEGPPVAIAENDLKSESQRSCSGCGQMGHFEFECFYLDKPYPSVNPSVCSYADVYAHDQNIQRPNYPEDMPNMFLNVGSNANRNLHNDILYANDKKLLAVKSSQYRPRKELVFHDHYHDEMSNVINRVNFQGPTGFLSQFVGQNINVPKILNFQQLPDTAGQLTHFILQNTSVPKRDRNVDKMYACLNAIKQIERRPFNFDEIRVIKRNYIKIHTILFAHFKELEGGRYMHILRNIISHLQSCDRRDTVSRIIIRQARKALSYICDEDPKQINYLQIFMKLKRKQQQRQSKHVKKRFQGTLNDLLKGTVSKMKNARKKKVQKTQAYPNKNERNNDHYN